MTECSLLLLALHDDGDEGLVLKEGMTAEQVSMVNVRIQALMEQKQAYARLTPVQKLDLALSK